jgi:hypothetical protein
MLGASALKTEDKRVPTVRSYCAVLLRHGRENCRGQNFPGLSPGEAVETASETDEATKVVRSGSRLRQGKSLGICLCRRRRSVCAPDARNTLPAQSKRLNASATARDGLSPSADFCPKSTASPENAWRSASTTASLRRGPKFRTTSPTGIVLRVPLPPFEQPKGLPPAMRPRRAVRRRRGDTPRWRYAPLLRKGARDADKDQRRSHGSPGRLLRDAGRRRTRYGAGYERDPGPRSERGVFRPLGPARRAGRRAGAAWSRGLEG